MRAAKEHIAAGDIYQVVLSQRFEAEVAADPFTVYRALRHVNPSPYMYFIRMGGVSVVGSSPEMLVRVEGSRVETHPIAGTRPRGRNDEEDMRLAEELKRNEKERAEHVMLVDLGRNDVGRVCEYGSVRVPQFMGLERFSHVMHLTSIVEGKLADDRDRLDALVSCFPGGHGVGRAESARDADHRASSSRRAAGSTPARSATSTSPATSISASRSARSSCRDGKAYVQAGAGIVMDSNPAAEYEETRDKARALLRALELRAGRALAVGEAQLMVFVIDNYDSFTYNLVQYLGELGAEVRGACATTRSRSTRSRRRAPDRIVISPGPGRPEDAGIDDGGDPAIRADDADSRRLPRPPGDRRGVRRRRSCAPRCRCTARRRRSSTTAAACSRGIAGPFVAVALPLAGGRGRAAAGGRSRSPRGRAEDGDDHGPAPSHVAGARRAVSSRVDPDRRGTADPAQLPGRPLMMFTAAASKS